MTWSLASPLVLFQSLWRHRSLIKTLAVREISSRYRGTVLGMVWSFALPLATVAVYTFVFGVIMKARWPGATSESLISYSIILFCGLTAFGFFSETIIRSPLLVVGNPTYVKKIVFPLEILPVVTAIVSGFNVAINVFLIIMANFLIDGKVSWLVILFPLTLCPLVLITVGLSWILASIGVYVRDLAQGISLAVQILAFIAPIYYPLSRVPDRFQPWVMLNPIAVSVESFRQVLLWDSLPNVKALLVCTLAGFLVCQIGFAWFMSTKHTFADVL